MLTRLIPPTVLGIAALLALAPPAYAQLSMAADFPCAAPESVQQFQEGGAVGAAIRIGRSLPGLGRKNEPSAVCLASQSGSEEELLMLTARMIDRAALSAAQGLDFIQLSLGRQRTFLEKIAELKTAAEGIRIANPDTTEGLIAQLSAESPALLVELQQRKDEMKQDPAIVENLKKAQSSLNEVEFYAVSASVGGTLFGQQFAKSSNAERTQLALRMQRFGLTSDFAEKLPKRSTSVRSTIKDTVGLRSGISNVVKNAEDTNDGTKRAKAQAKADLEAQRQERQKNEAYGRSSK